MYTETELREALQHSAGRAEGLSADRAAGDVVHIGAAAHRRQRRRWLRMGTPAAAAASVVVIAMATVAMVSVFSRNSDTQRNPAGAASTPSPKTATRPAAPKSAKVDNAGVVDTIRVGSSGNLHYQIWVDGTESASRVLGPLDRPDSNSIVVEVVPKSSSAFKAARIPRARTVQIAGTTGYYSLFRLYPLDGSTAPGVDKERPHWTIAFQTPAGDWAFAHLEKPAPVERIARSPRGSAASSSSRWPARDTAPRRCSRSWTVSPSHPTSRIPRSISLSLTRPQ